MTLLDVMSRSAEGVPGTPLSWPELSRFLREHYWQNEANKQRKASASVRQAFYDGITVGASTGTYLGVAIEVVGKSAETGL